MSYWDNSLKRVFNTTVVDGGSGGTGNIGTVDGFRGYDVFLLIGQSNMVGAGTPPSSVLDWSSPAIEQWGQSTAEGTVDIPCLATDPLQHPNMQSSASLGMSFARLYAQSLAAGRKVLLVPCAWQGTAFSGPNTATTTTAGASVTLNWLANTPNNLLDLAIKRTNRAMAYHPVLNNSPAYTGSTPPTPSPFNAFKGILWHQGESDVGLNEGTYRTNLQNLVNNVRANVISASNSTVFLAGYPTQAIVNANQASGPILALPKVGNLAYFPVANCAFVSSLTPTVIEGKSGDIYHFSNKGYHDYGARYYQTYLSMTRPAPLLSNVRVVSGFDAGTGIRATWTPDANTYVTGLALALSGQTVANAYTTGSAYVFANVTNGLQYDVLLTPRTQTGIAGDTTLVTVTTSGTPPATPMLTNLQATSSGLSSAQVSWTSTNTTTVRVSYGAGSSPSSYTMFSTPTASPVTVTGLSAGTLYTIRVVPYNGTLPGTTSTVQVTTDPPPPPSAPPSNILIMSAKPTSSSVPTVDDLGSTLTKFSAPAVYSDATRGYVFDTTNGYFTLSLSLPASYTKAAWVYQTVATEAQNIISANSTSAGSTHYLTRNDTNAVVGSGHTTDFAYQVTTPSSAIPLNTWVHVAVTYDKPSNTMIMYINGVSVNTNASTPSWAGGVGGLAIGGFSNLGLTYGWKGYIDTARVYSRALTGSEIMYVFQEAPATPPATPLLENLQATSAGPSSAQMSWTSTNTTTVQVSYGAGSSPSSYVVFSTASASPVTVTGLQASTLYTIRAVPYNGSAPGTASTTQVTTGAAAPSAFANVLVMSASPTSSSVPMVDDLGNTLTVLSSPAVFNDPTRGYVFDTTNGYFTLSLSLPASYTKAAWVYQTVATGAQNIVSANSTSAGSTHYLTRNDTNAVVGSGHTTDFAYQVTTPSSAIPLNTWVHVAVAYDKPSNTMIMYINGVSVNTNASTPSWAGGVGGLAIGGFSNLGLTYGWKGYIDNVRVYSRALTGPKSPASIRQPDSSSELDHCGVPFW